MSQIVKIECSNCEGVETCEMDGCILIGWHKGGGLLFKQHDITLGDVVDQLIDAVMKEKEGKNEKS